jgi:hypothetical protein
MLRIGACRKHSRPSKCLGDKIWADNQHVRWRCDWFQGNHIETSQNTSNQLLPQEGKHRTVKKVAEGHPI